MDWYPPPKWEPVKPAIIRIAEPWERRVNADLIKKGFPLSVRQDIVRALRSVIGKQSSIIRAAESDLSDYTKRIGYPVLGLGGSFASLLASISGSASPVFPQVRSAAAGSGGSTSATSHNADLPASYNAGDYLVLIYAAQVNSTATWNTPSGWTAHTATQNGASQGQTCVIYKAASGSEGSTVAITTTGTSTRAAWNSYAIYNHDSGTAPYVVLSADAGASTTADPENTTPSWGSYKNLWIALVASKESNTPSVDPTSYGNAITGVVTTTNGPTVHSVRRELEASSENPSAFTHGSSRFVVGTIAIKGGTV